MATIFSILLTSFLLVVCFPSFHSKNTSNHHTSFRSKSISNHHTSYRSKNTSNHYFYLKKACDCTPHKKLCIRSLAPFSYSVPKDSPREWARLAVSVAMSEYQHISNCLAKKHQGSLAYTDCNECMRDATVQLLSSYAELKELDKPKFKLQMNDIETWVSAALTDANTCIDGLMYYKGKQIGGVRHRVLKAARLCGNALAFVNKLASSGNIN